MQTKIFEALEQNYASLGLGKEILQGHATALNATGSINDENFETVIKSQGEVLSAIQKKFDRAVGEKTKLEQELEKLRTQNNQIQTTTTQTVAQTTEPPKSDEMPSWAKAILDEVKSSKTEVENIKREKSMEQKKKEAMEMFSKLNISDNTKGLANKAQSWVFSNIKDEDTAETLYARMKDEYDSLASSIGLNGYKPIVSSGGGEKPEKKWAAEAEKRKAQVQSKN